MSTDCNERQLCFVPLARRSVQAAFDAGRTTSDAGLLLIREVVERSGALRRLAACFTDLRDPVRVEHTVEELVGQRVLGLVAGYEDLVDHDWLRDDPLLAVAVGKDDADGRRRAQARDRGHALAGKSTLSRLDLAGRPDDPEHRYKRIVVHDEAMDGFFVDEFLRAHDDPPSQIVLDLDATDDPLHGRQEGRFFHGYYRRYCYLPLYIFCDDHLLLARLRPSNIDASAGTVEELGWIVPMIRQRWPDVRIVVRADSGFCREPILRWCEDNGVDYVIGLQRNERLSAMVAPWQALVGHQARITGRPAKLYVELTYRTLDSWSRSRRVVGKVERLGDKDNPRFVVTSLSVDEADAKALYARWYCARGDMENRIKEQQLDMFSTRTSCHALRSNQLRLWWSSVAYVLMAALRRTGLRGTELERAQAGTIRTRLIKLAGIVKISVRRVRVALSSVYPLQGLFERILLNIQRNLPLRC